MKDLMVDIETLGSSPNSVITQIGACYFDRHSGEIGDKFLVNIRIQDCLDWGLKVDGETIKWWFGQTFDKTFLKDAVDLTKALGQFREFAKETRKKNGAAWAHSTFDFPILANAYRTVNLSEPFPYRAMRDIRTLVDLANLPYEKPKEEKTHNGLDDCLYQVSYCVKCLNQLRPGPGPI